MLEKLIETLEWYAGQPEGDRARALLREMRSSDGENVLVRLVEEVAALIEEDQGNLSEAGKAVEQTLTEISD